MSSSHVSRHGAKPVAVLAVLFALLVAVGTGSSSLRKNPQGVVPQGPGGEPPRYVGDAPAPLPESEAIVLQNTPAELVASVLAARTRRDLAALARCCSTSAGRQLLDQLDAVRAERDFFESEQLWTRLAAAAAGQALRVETQARPAPEQGTAIDATGTVAFASGSAAIAELQLSIVHIGGAWFLRVSP